MEEYREGLCSERAKHFNFEVVVFQVSKCHNRLLNLFNDSKNAINQKLFVRLTDLIVCVGLDTTLFSAK